MLQFKRHTLLLLGLSLLPQWLYAQSFELQAIHDFPVIDSGEVPYYKDLAGDRNVLAINAANEAYREKFARADHEFTGPDGLYDITLHAVGELDGNGEYHVLVNGVLQGSAINPSVTTDYQVVKHVFSEINLTTAATISIESNAKSNNAIPEGDGFAFARGRWRTLTIEPHVDATEEEPVQTNLAMSATRAEKDLVVGDKVELFFTLINAEGSATATAPNILATLPESLSFNSSADCSQRQTGVYCQLPELISGQSYSVSFVLEVLVPGWSSVSATATADQIDTDTSNNTTNLSFEAEEATTDSTNTSSSNGSSTASTTDTNTNISTTTDTNTNTNTNTSATTETNTSTTTGANTGTGTTANTEMTTAESAPNNTTTTQTETMEQSDDSSGSTTLYGLVSLCVFALFRRRFTKNTL